MSQALVLLFCCRRQSNGSHSRLKVEVQCGVSIGPSTRASERMSGDAGLKEGFLNVGRTTLGGHCLGPSETVWHAVCQRACGQQGNTKHEPAVEAYVLIERNQDLCRKPKVSGKAERRRVRALSFRCLMSHEALCTSANRNPRDEVACRYVV